MAGLTMTKSSLAPFNNKIAAAAFISGKRAKNCLLGHCLRRPNKTKEETTMRNALLPVVVFGFLTGMLLPGLAKAQNAAPPSQPPTQGAAVTHPEDHQPGMMLKELFERVGASAEQMAKAEAIMKEASEKAAAAQTPEEKMTIRREAMENIRNNVLTEEQRAKMHKPGADGHNIMAMLDQVGASAEQKTKAEAILKDAHEKAAAAQTPEEKKTIWREAMENIRNNVLTEEQRAKTHKPGADSHNIMAMLDKVGATAEQKTKAETILKEAKKRRRLPRPRKRKRRFGARPWKTSTITS